MTDQNASPDGYLEVSVVMPCLNEAETLESCIRKAMDFLRNNRIAGEIIVADNGSTDASPDIAARLGARVVRVAERGYGSALSGGFKAARGKYIVMGDADASYDFSSLMPFVEKLREGFDLVMGNRFKGGIAPGAMPTLHRYVGNSLLTGIGRLFFSSPCGDFHCGLRAFTRDAVRKMDLQTSGMEFASEIVVKATLMRMRIVEIPTTLSPDGRRRPPHLRSWRDGWRHLRFLLLYSPRWLFLYPGIALLVMGIFTLVLLLPRPLFFGRVALDIHTMLYAGIAILIGFQSVAFAAFSKVFAISEGLLPRDPKLAKMFRYIKLETGLAAGVCLVAAGLIGTFYAVGRWEAGAFGELDPVRTMRVVIPSAVSFTLGIQVIFSSFFMSVLGLRRANMVEPAGE